MVTKFDDLSIQENDWCIKLQDHHKIYTLHNDTRNKKLSKRVSYKKMKWLKRDRCLKKKSETPEFAFNENQMLYLAN